MKITDFLSEKNIQLNGTANTKDEALGKMADLMYRGGNLKNRDEYLEGIKKREEESTTAVGEGVAIPHYKGAAVINAGLAAMVIPNGMDFDSVDGEPTKLIFAIAAPNTKENVHLDVLSSLSVLLTDENFINELINAKTTKEFIELINKKENQDDQKIVEVNSYKNICAVTGCPTGIAHTYMAAEKLSQAANKKGVNIKVETRGSSGVKNTLTNDDIENAECIIVAADTSVPMDRFNGKKVIVTRVANGISNADELVDRAITGDAKVYHSERREEPVKEEKTGFGHSIYTHLMNGVSHMLPFIIGGGILTAIAFLLDDFSINESNFGSNTPIAALFKTIGGISFNFMLPVLAGFIAYSIADRPGLAVGFVGGMFASNGNAVYEFSVKGNFLSNYLANTVFNATGNTVSGFLGALAAGFAAGYIILFLKKCFSKFPSSLDGIKPMLLYPVLGIFIIGALMLFIFNPIIGIINTGLANFLNSMGSTSKIILGLVLGAMMAIDMGGPINKAAYVFGTIGISEGNYDVMAAVMIGGMVPPLGIALATTFFKNKFTRAQRQTSITNYIMGLSFITEGAIPFAAADPVHVIPATAIGAAVAGGLSMLFNCTLMAPHGGIFVFAVVGNWPMYLVSLVVGSVVTMLLLKVLKKDVHEKEGF